MRRHPDHPNGPAERLDRAQANRLLKSGLGGALFAALCCFTPLLVVVLAGAGLSAVTGWLDYALFPLLFVSFAVVAQALWLRAARPGPPPRSGPRSSRCCSRY
ncbi:mercury resistance system transport protein MerF [Aurantimonas coralicida]|uniref:mercury resistance system transport protein MerF n=1 Tax=Aurantimonas coralicida TaxID=182270 RepID=UPI001D1907C6|nr:mercury resistance system transport protein MerF [Aurantimonas coralicida]MCC4298526.1 mercury resistance system transport protein MerF [Aurantimonas coralicida]